MVASHFELQLRIANSNTLIAMMVEQKNAIDKGGVNQLELKAMLSYCFNELVYKLSSANDKEIMEINHLLSDKAHTFIQKALTKFYKQNYEALEQAANNLASFVYEERKELLQEVGNYDSLDQSGTSDAITKFKHYKAHDILKGTAPKIVAFLQDSKNQAYGNNNIGDALQLFWEKLNNNQINLVISESSSEDDSSKETVSANEDISLSKDWIYYKNNILHGIKALSNPEASILLKDSSSITSFFKDIVNSVCEKIGITAPFSQHKMQQNFKETIEKIRQHSNLEDAPVEHKFSNGPQR